MTGRVLPQDWTVVSAQIDRLLDVPQEERHAWLAQQTMPPELRRWIEQALQVGELHSPLDAAPWQEPVAHPLRLGAWRILRPLGAGGSASVFLAERVDGEFRHVAALKLLRSGVLDPVERARFVQERALLANLSHPGIARLIDGGVSPEGAPYLVLDYVDGETITAWCARRELRLDARLALFAAICEAVDYAHRNLVVHRDLKPANIMVDGEGRVKLLDFGIARLLDDGAAETRTDARRATPAYAAPEQLHGGPVTTAIDVHALGVLLHELASGDLPAATASRSSARLRHRWVDHAPLDRGLLAIVEHATETDPEGRYGSVAALADDVQRYRRGAALHAPGTSPWYRWRRALRRHWRPLAAGTAIVVVVATAAIVAATEADAARREARRESATRAFLVDLLASASPEAAVDRRVDVAALIERGVARADHALAESPESHAEVLSVSGRLLTALGRYDQADAVLQQAFAVERTLPDTDPAGRPQTRLALIQLLRQREQPALAIERLRPLLAQLRATPADRALLADALATLGTLLSLRQEHAEALPLLREALALQQRRGADAALIADAQRQLGDAMARTGDAAGALDVLRAAQQAAPPNTLLQSRLLLSIGYAEERAGASASARETFTQALAIQQRLLPAQHADTAATLTALGTAEFALDRPAEAMQYYRDALAMREALFGTNSVQAGEAEVAVAVTASQLQRPEESIAAFESAMSRFEGSPEPPIERMSWALANYAGVLRRHGRLQQAAEVAARGAQLVRGLFPPATEKRLAAELEYARALRGAGRLDEASAVIDAGLGLAAPPAMLASYRITAAELAADRREHATAIAGFRAVLAMADLPRTQRTDAWRGLALAYEAGGREDDARQAREQLAAVAERPR